MARSIRFGPGASFAAVGVAVSLAFVNLFDADLVPSRRDLLLFFLPFKAFLAQSLRGGDVPLWNPHVFLGTPFLASLQTGVLYPPSALLLLPFPLGFNVFLLFHYFIALGGAWVLLRSRGLGLAASSLGSVTFVIGGCLVSLLNVMNHLQSAAWTPLVLFLWGRHLERPSSSGMAVLVGAIVLQILGGSPEVVLMTVTVLVAHGILRSFPDVERAGRVAVQLFVVFGIATGLSAFQVLPTAELTRHSVRGSAFIFEQVSFWSLEPVSLLQLLFPHSSALLTAAEGASVGQMLESQVPWLSSLYIGLVPLCLVVVGITCGRERAFWGGVAAVAVILALGRNTPVFPFLYDLVPALFGKFRYPEKFWFLVHLAAAVLCAEGAEQVVRGNPKARRLATVAASTFLAIGLAVLGIRWMWPLGLLQMLATLRGMYLPLFEYADLATDIVFKSQRLVVILVAFFTLLHLERRGMIRSAMAAGALVMLAGADLVGAHYDLNLSISWSQLMNRLPMVNVERLRQGHLRVFNYQTVSSPRWGKGGDAIAGLEETLRVLYSVDDVREYALREWPGLPGNAGILYGVGTIGGGEAIDRGEIEMMRDVLAIVPRERAVHLLRLYSVGALVGSAPLEVRGLRLVASDDSHFAYEISEPVPRAYLASRLRPAENLLAAFNGMIHADFKPRREAVVERLPKSWRNGDGKGPQGEVRIDRYSNDLVILRTRAASPALLVLNDSWFPGWEASMDGSPVEILRTNALVRGVVVPAGEHEVRFAYRPLSFRLGAGISVLTGIIFSAWLMLRSGRRGGLRPR